MNDNFIYIPNDNLRLKLLVEHFEQVQNNQSRFKVPNVFKPKNFGYQYNLQSTFSINALRHTLIIDFLRCIFVWLKRIDTRLTSFYVAQKEILNRH